MMNLPAHTWRGILEHLVGIQDFSGHNGLATFVYAKPNVDAVVFELSFRERFYGSRSTGVSESASVKIPTPIRLPFGGQINGSVGTKIGGLEINGGMKGEWDLLGVFKFGKFLTQKTPATKFLSRAFDFIITQIPDVKGSGELALYLGITHHRIPYFRLQTGIGVSFKFGSGVNIPGLNLATNIRGLSSAAGRSWQIQLNHPLDFIPGLDQLSY